MYLNQVFKGCCYSSSSFLIAFMMNFPLKSNTKSKFILEAKHVNV